MSTSTSPLKLHEYDLIIVGGGTSACVLANRLSDPSHNLQILMLEAGQDANQDPRISTPGLFTTLFDDPERDWAYMCAPSPGLNNRKMGQPRGKCIGGSSAINLMAMVYSSKSSLDAWADINQDEGWGWEGMARYFRRFQTHQPPSREVQQAMGIDYLDVEGNDAAHIGTSGPIKASYPPGPHPIYEAWLETWKTLGKRGSPISGRGVGGFTVPASVDREKGVRSHAGNEYYEPVKGRGNLDVVTEAVVERILLEKEEEGEGGEVVAKGVVFEYQGSKYEARAKKEVVLCAGTIADPQLLELSGIGDKTRLEGLGIECMVDNPNVGENLQDHLMVGPSFEVKDGIPTVDMVRDPAVIQAALAQYQESHSGPLAMGGGYSFAYTPLVDFITPEDNSREALTALLDEQIPSTDKPKFKAQEKQYEYIKSVILSPTETSATAFIIPVQFNSQELLTKDKFSIKQPENYVSIMTQLSHPFSRGSIHITSPNIKDHPRISPNYLSHPLDVEILARHIRQMEVLANTPPLSGLLKEGGRRLPDNQHGLSLDAAKKFARSSATSQYHPTGTCAMMPKELGGVVDSRLRVYGVKGLRVVDASIFPIEPRGNIQSCVYVVAEKGADLIKEDLGFGLDGTE